MSTEPQRLTDLNLAYNGLTAANGLPAYGARPIAGYGAVTTSTSDAESEYTSIGLSLRRRLRDGFQYGVSVAWSEDEDSDSNERNFAGIQAGFVVLVFVRQRPLRFHHAVKHTRPIDAVARGLLKAECEPNDQRRQQLHRVFRQPAQQLYWMQSALFQSRG